MARSSIEADIRRIYLETIDDLYGFISRRCDGDRGLAEDLTQDTWMRAIVTWRRDGLPDKPLAWLTSVDVDTLPVEPPPERDDRLPLLQRAIARLPFMQAQLLRAFHFDKRAVAELAEQTGLSQRAVEGRLRRARHQLKRAIETDIANGVHSYE